MSTYYDRQLIDGVEWRQPEDANVEDMVRSYLSEQWACKVMEYPQFHGIDWYAVRDKRVLANIEFKGRNHASDKYPTVYLSQNKYLTLLLSYLATGTPGLFVVRWADGAVASLDVGTVTPKELVVAGAGRLRHGETRLAQEPCLEIPIDMMMRVGHV